MFFLHFFCAYSYLRSTFHNTKNLTLKNGSRAFEWDRSFLDITFLLPWFGYNIFFPPKEKCTCQTLGYTNTSWGCSLTYTTHFYRMLFMHQAHMCNGYANNNVVIFFSPFLLLFLFPALSSLKFPGSPTNIILGFMAWWSLSSPRLFLPSSRGSLSLTQTSPLRPTLRSCGLCSTSSKVIAAPFFFFFLVSGKVWACQE